MLVLVSLCVVKFNYPALWCNRWHKVNNISTSNGVIWDITWVEYKNSSEQQKYFDTLKYINCLFNIMIQIKSKLKTFSNFSISIFITGI